MERSSYRSTFDSNDNEELLYTTFDTFARGNRMMNWFPDEQKKKLAVFMEPEELRSQPPHEDRSKNQQPRHTVTMVLKKQATSSTRNGEPNEEFVMTSIEHEDSNPGSNQTAEDCVEKSALILPREPQPIKLRCFVWIPTDEGRRAVCEACSRYVLGRIQSRGMALDIRKVELPEMILRYPIVIMCIPPEDDRQVVSVGDMDVALFVIHRQPAIHNEPTPPHARDLYWRRYRNLAMVVNMVSSGDTIQDTIANLEGVEEFASVLISRLSSVINRNEQLSYGK